MNQALGLSINSNGELVVGRSNMPVEGLNILFSGMIFYVFL